MNSWQTTIMLDHGQSTSQSERALSVTVAGSSDTASEVFSWLDNNIAHPFVNSAVFEPYDAVASSVNAIVDAVSGHQFLPEINIETTSSKFLSPDWLAQTIAGGLGMIAPYMVAGKISGSVMSRSASALALDGKAFDLLNSRQAAQIVGATIYGGMMKPGQGQTRLGDALSSAAAFSIFGLGNRLTSGFNPISKLATRFVTGAIGGASQSTIGQLASDQELPSMESFTHAAISGAVLNTAMPAAQDGLAKAGAYVKDGIWQDTQGGIHSVGDPNARLQDQPEAMLHATRLAAQGGNAAVDSALTDAIKSNAGKIGQVPGSQVAEELKGILTSGHPESGLQLMMDTGLMKELFPELDALNGPKGLQDPYWHPEGSAWEHSKMVVDNAPRPDVELRMAALFHDIGKPETQEVHEHGISNHGHAEVGANMFADIAQRLELPEDQTARIDELIRNHMIHDVETWSPDQLKALLERSDIEKLIKLESADATGRGGGPHPTQKAFLTEKLAEEHDQAVAK